MEACSTGKRNEKQVAKKRNEGKESEAIRNQKARKAKRGTKGSGSFCRTSYT
jgi:hypothetical protein